MNEGRDNAVEQFMVEYLAWDSLVAQVQGEDLDQDLKTGAVDAIAVLRLHLGEGWPARAIGRDHPITYLLLNRAKWTRSYLRTLADAMDLVACLPQWKGLRNRLRRADKAVGAIFELDLAARALRQGLAVVLEPQTRGTRKADLAISRHSYRSDVLYVEATHLKPFPETAYNAERLTERVFPTFLVAWGLCGGGRFLRAPRPDEVPNVEKRADEFWARRQRDHAPGELIVEGLLVLWAADQGDHETIDAFVSRGFPGPGNFTGPPFALAPLKRISQALRAKSRQLPDAAGGIIALEAPEELDLVHVSSEDICRVVESALRRHQHVNAAALVRLRFASHDPTHQFRDLGRGNASLVSPRYLVFAEEVLLVRNPLRAYVEADEIIERVFAAPGSSGLDGVSAGPR
jgi:hypothetical protein